VAKGFIKGEALRLLRTNSSKALFEENINNFKSRLSDRGYPKNVVEKTLIEVKFEERKYALQEKQKVRKNILPFVTQYNPSVPNLKKVLMSKWHIIEKPLEDFIHIQQKKRLISLSQKPTGNILPLNSRLTYQREIQTS